MHVGGNVKRRKRMRKGLLATLLGLLGLLSLAAQAPKVPDDIQVRILRIQKDQLIQQNSLTQLNNQFQEAYNKQADPMNKALKSDSHELDLLKAEALKVANLDTAKFDLDLEKLIFVPKPAPSEPKTPPAAPAPAPQAPSKPRD